MRLLGYLGVGFLIGRLLRGEKKRSPAQAATGRRPIRVRGIRLVLSLELAAAFLVAALIVAIVFR